MDVKNTKQTEINIVVNKTTVTINPKDTSSKARVVLTTKKDNSYVTNKDQLVIDGPGEYEVGGISIQALSPKTKVDDNTDMYVFVQADGSELLVLPNVQEIPENIIEELGQSQAVCVPYLETNSYFDDLARLVRQLSDVNTVLVLCDQEVDESMFHKISSRVSSMVSSMKLKHTTSTTEPIDGVDIVILRSE